MLYTGMEKKRKKREQARGGSVYIKQLEKERVKELGKIKKIQEQQCSFQFDMRTTIFIIIVM